MKKALFLISLLLIVSSCKRTCVPSVINGVSEEYPNICYSWLSSDGSESIIVFFNKAFSPVRVNYDGELALVEQDGVRTIIVYPGEYCLMLNDILTKGRFQKEEQALIRQNKINIEFLLKRYIEEANQGLKHQ